MTDASFVQPAPDRLRLAIEQANGADEATCIEPLLKEADPGADGPIIQKMATDLVERVRSEAAAGSALDAFMQQYDLSSREGVALMCLAEALLRIPDSATADQLIAEKIGGADWARHVGESDSLFVNASTWALMLTGRLVRLDDPGVREPRALLRRLVARSGEPLIRQAVLQAMRIIGRQFVIGRTIDEALIRAREGEARGYLYSFDMLGESALTAADADRYFAAYARAIERVGRANAGRGPFEGPGVSIKLSALHPRFVPAKRDRVQKELIPRVRELVLLARRVGIGVCIDTEEADRLELTLDVVAAVFPDPALAGWEGFGVAVQAYQKRARPLIDWYASLALGCGRRLAVRLVKGAYWDAEIKRAQELGLAEYPVFTLKANTDVSYLACAYRLLAEPRAFRCAFATHNAHTLAAVWHRARGRTDYEFQRLHGMGDALYDTLATGASPEVTCRIYAPVGNHAELLAYLVRRLLENGSNTSFVNRIFDADLPVSAVVTDPTMKVRHHQARRHPCIPLPRDVFGDGRKAAQGLDLADPAAVRELLAAIDSAPAAWQASPLIAGEPRDGGNAREVRSPQDRRQSVGCVVEADAAAIAMAVEQADAAARRWDATAADERARCLERAADRMEAEMPVLMALLVREAGKTLPDALAEVREAVDFCRYYAAGCRREFSDGDALPGPTGESNVLTRHGRGVFACISPWNFPLAIFVGQVAAALAAGNAVIGKPAEQTPLIAAAAVRILYDCGVPDTVLSLLPGDGGVGAALIADPRISGVAFTGGTETAFAINRALAGRPGPIVPLIAETGGINVMLVDSSALAEQVVTDVLTSAFRSAGQRCSALRVLFLQSDVAAKITHMLAGAMAEVQVGDPGRLSSDVGPIIDDAALAALHSHDLRMRREGRLIAEVSLAKECANGTFFAPRAFAVDHLRCIDREVFGPILHVVEYRADRLDAVLDSIDALGYGLTLGIQSRIEGFAKRVHGRLRIGNTYVNRNMIGAVVGSQPFGGERLSGTGPKAGGPWYLHRFASERTFSINLTAAGGNAALLSLDDRPDTEADGLAVLSGECESGMVAGPG